MEHDYDLIAQKLEMMENDLEKINSEINSIWRLLTGRGNGGVGLCADMKNMLTFVQEYKDRQKQVRNVLITQSILFLIAILGAAYKMLFIN